KVMAFGLIHAVPFTLPPWLWLTASLTNNGWIPNPASVYALLPNQDWTESAQLSRWHTVPPGVSDWQVTSVLILFGLPLLMRVMPVCIHPLNAPRAKAESFKKPRASSGK